jgi:N-acetylneuraminic acid mutarotase
MEQKYQNKGKVAFLFKLSLFLLICHSQLFGQSWQEYKTENLCTNRHENSMTCIGNQLVLVGGRKIKPVEVLNLKTNKWTKLTETPIEMHHFQAITFEKELWVLGAFTGQYPHEKPIEHIYIFNPEKNEWRKGAEIPKERNRGAAGVFVHNKKIYIVCGIKDGHWDGHVAWLDEFDPKTNTWKTLPDAPHARDHFQAIVIDNKIYVAGGRRSSGVSKQVFQLTEPAVDVFDFKTNSWKTLPESLNIPTQRAGTSSVQFKEKLLVIGGESASQKTSHNEVEAFNTKTNKWEKLNSLIQGRHGTSVAKHKNKIYIVAGSANMGGGPELNTVEVFKK